MTTALIIVSVLLAVAVFAVATLSFKLGRTLRKLSYVGCVHCDSSYWGFPSKGIKGERDGWEFCYTCQSGFDASKDGRCLDCNAECPNCSNVYESHIWGGKCPHCNPELFECEDHGFFGKSYGSCPDCSGLSLADRLQHIGLVK